MIHQEVKKLEKLREKCKFKKKKIADNLDVSPQTYSTWLNDGYGPSEKKLEKIEDLNRNLQDISKLING